jgi:ubiquinone/menaquinone biosynthesis C-methylase UbiE
MSSKQGSNAQTIWADGDYAVIGTTLQIVSEELCEAMDVRGGQRLLDIGAGTGNGAIAAARRSCDVIALDYAYVLLERARARLLAEGLFASLLQGNAEYLPFPDDTFDATFSAFGIMFAPDQQKAASEMMRVCRPGGTIGMANWIPEGVFGQSAKITAKFIPPNPTLPSPALWGDPEHLRHLFGSGLTMSFRSRSIMYRYRSVDHYLTTLRETYPPMIKTFRTLNEAEQDQLATALREFYDSKNEARDGTFVMAMEYLEVVGQRID